MTVLMDSGVPAYLFGWCAACHSGGRFVPAVDLVLQLCQTHLPLLPRRPAMAGQLPLVDVAEVPPALRAPYATGEQQWCSDCVAAGVPRPRRGLSERTAGDATPLCLTCWRSRQERARRGDRRLSADEAGQLAELVERLRCEACGQDSDPQVDLPPAAVEARRRWRRGQRSRPARPAPARRRSGCWRCEDPVWIAGVRAVHEQDQAEAAREREAVDELTLEHRKALAWVRRTQRRLDDTVGWRDRVAEVVDALPRLSRTGSGGRLRLTRGERRQARAWWLLADFLARDAADRTARQVSARGRPSAYPLVVAVMAVDARTGSGRRTMAGLHRTARFARVASRTVTTGWARSVELGSTRRVMVGRSCTLAVREATGRRRSRSVYDFAPVHRSEMDPTAYLGESARLLAQLLQIAEDLVAAEERVVADAHRQAEAVEARLLEARAVVAERRAEDLLLQAAVAAPTDPGRQLQAQAAGSWQAQAKQAADEALAWRARATRAASPPLDAYARVAAHRAIRAAAAAAEARVEEAFERAERIRIFATSPVRGSARRSTSGLLWGLSSPVPPTSPLAGGKRPVGRGGKPKGRASRASTAVDSGPTSTRPRTDYGNGRASQRQRRAPATLWWAKPLAAAVARQLPMAQRFLDDSRRHPAQHDRQVARERGLRLRQLALTLGAQLSREWLEHPDELVTLIEQHGLADAASGLLPPGAAHSPLRYIKIVLHRALTNPDAVVRWYSPVRAAWQAERAAAQRAADAAAQAAVRAALEARDAEAGVEQSGAQLGRKAARAVAAAAAQTAAPTTPRRTAADPDRMAQARAELDALRSRPAATEIDPHDHDWPAARQPGSGLPAEWHRGDGN
ncbi:hypothetical protein [Actinoplanes sp. G11-F43]|uniref:hypothetical protein n=1 Tax=Actinoplanes sp. G11-F43 TaxID=3424130 RepID=UPI003D341B8F